MPFMAAPYMTAGFYWHDMSEHISLQRVCAYLMQRGMTTLECGDDAAPNDALLRLLQHPETALSEIKFITSDRLPPHGKKTRRPPGHIIVSYDYISDEAVTYGDHRSIDIEWSGAPVSGAGWDLSKKKATLLAQYTRRDFNFFIDACIQLDPLYARFDIEALGLVACLYDYTNRPVQETWRSNNPSYIRDGMLSTSEVEAVRSICATVQKLPNGMFFSAHPWMMPGKKHPTKLVAKAEHPALRAVLLPALRRFRRSQQ